jgi:hypothetical protein
MTPSDRFADDCGTGETGAAENMNASHRVSLPDAAPAMVGTGC